MVVFFFTQTRTSERKSIIRESNKGSELLAFIMVNLVDEDRDKHIVTGEADEIFLS